MLSIEFWVIQKRNNLPKVKNRNIKHVANAPFHVHSKNMSPMAMDFLRQKKLTVIPHLVCILRALYFLAPLLSLGCLIFHLKALKSPNKESKVQEKPSLIKRLLNE